MSQVPDPAALSPQQSEAQRTGQSPYPVRAIQVETSSICNFRCASCALSLADYDRPEKHMSPEDFERVIEAFPDVQKIELQGVGEVFLNPRVLELIARARQRGIEVHTFSNASLITRELAAGIVGASIERINFSLDGADEATFRRLRKGGTLARYKRSFHNLTQAKSVLESAVPHLGVMSVISKENYLQVPKLIAIAEELGAESIMLTKLNSGPKPDQEPLLLGPAEHAWLEALPPYRGKVEVLRAYTPWTKEERMDCYWPKTMSYVTVEGFVTPCCNYFDSREIHFGNVFDGSWAGPNGAAYRAFRQRLWNGDLPSKCQSC